MNTASHSGQRTDDGGEDAETTSAEQKILRRMTQSQRISSSSYFYLCHFNCGRKDTFHLLLADA